MKYMGAYIDFFNYLEEKGIWKPGKKVMAIIAEDTDWGRTFGKAFGEKAIENGWRINRREYILGTQTDFYPLISELKKASVDVAACSIYALAAVTGFIKQANEVGYKGLIIADGLSWFGEWYDLVGPASDGTLDQVNKWATPAAKAVAESIENRFGYRPSAMAAGNAYDSARFFIKIAQRAFEKYGKLDSGTIQKIVSEEVVPGKLIFSADQDGAVFTKRYRYTEQTQPDPVVGIEDWYLPIVQYEKGEPVIVFPERLKEREFKVEK
jgi:ABC-type branched-subunit amino acid transport system substrate-binding protein